MICDKETILVTEYNPSISKTSSLYRNAPVYLLKQLYH